MAQFTGNVHSTTGHTDAAHAPPMPLWIAIIRILQLVLAIIILALTAFAASTFHYTYAGFGLAWFTFIWTIFFLAYIAVSSMVMPAIYNKWIHLGLEIATAFWWLITWAVLASEASSFNYYDGYGYNYEDYLPANYKSAINCWKASAGLGALEWILFIVTLVMFVLSIHRSRVANGMGTTTTGGPPGAAVMEGHKMETMPVQQQHYQQESMPVQQQHYQQQQMPVQQQHYQQQQMA